MFKSVILVSLMLTSQVFAWREHIICSKIDIKENIKACDGTDLTKMLKCVHDPNLEGGTWEFDSTCGYCCPKQYPLRGSYCAGFEADCKKQQGIQDKLTSLDPDYGNDLEALDYIRSTESKIPINHK